MNRVPDEAALERALTDMAGTLAALALPDPVLVGIHTGGVWVAQRLHALLGVSTPLATLDVSFYRDDYARSGLPAQVRPTELPALEGRHVVLVDDVLYTGRTVRAALGELFDYGRPAAVRLAVLVDRGGRELPICPDVVGLHLTAPAGERVKLLGPAPLRLERGTTAP